MVPNNYVKFIDTMKSLVSTGAVPMSRINGAVTHILRVKLQAGLFEYPYADNSLKALPWRPVPCEALRHTATVLQEHERLSHCFLYQGFKYARKVLVVGAHAKDIGLQCGDWTMSWQGSQTKGTTILGGIRQLVSKSTEVVYQANPYTGYARGKGFEYAIVLVGEH